MILLFACRFSPDDSAVESRAESDSSPPDTAPTSWVGPPRIFWGDLHAHTGLSHDGCEDPEAGCGPVDWLPGEPVFERAAENGLAFTAITDHAEFSRYQREADGVDLDIWERTTDLIAAAETGPVFGIPGYEWTGYCRFDELPDQKLHRTVLLEDPAPCAAWRVPSCHATSGSMELDGERYGYTELEAAITPQDLDAALQTRGDLEGCAPTRYAAFFHHTAEQVPAWVDWADDSADVPSDTVVEIASQHGSSECWDLAAEGCDWRMESDRHVPAGSIQRALQLGFHLGFVAGTDNHEANPGGLDGAGPVRNLHDPSQSLSQYTGGAVTGVLLESDVVTRATFFDALEVRHTVAASWVFEGLAVTATTEDGASWLPGDDVPAGTLTIEVSLDDPLVTEWTAEIVDPWGALEPVGVITLAAGDARYVRIRAWIGNAEHRVWASPYFGV